MRRDTGHQGNADALSRCRLNRENRSVRIREERVDPDGVSSEAVLDLAQAGVTPFQVNHLKEWVTIEIGKVDQVPIRDAALREILSVARF